MINQANHERITRNIQTWLNTVVEYKIMFSLQTSKGLIPKQFEGSISRKDFLRSLSDLFRFMAKNLSSRDRSANDKDPTHLLRASLDGLDRQCEEISRSICVATAEFGYSPKEIANAFAQIKLIVPFMFGTVFEAIEKSLISQKEERPVLGSSTLASRGVDCISGLMEFYDAVITKGKALDLLLEKVQADIRGGGHARGSDSSPSRFPAARPYPLE